MLGCGERCALGRESSSFKVDGDWSMKKEKTILAGDIGGTKTNLGLFARGERRPSPLRIESYPSRESPNLEHIIEEFLQSHPSSISSACFGIAGPVVNGRCKTTNLPWEVSEARLQKKFKWAKAHLLNDLAATALSIPLLTRGEWVSLNRGKRQEGGNVALVAPGTGLGQSLLVFHQGRYAPVSSEGGHVDFASNTEAQVNLWRFLRGKYGHVSVERVVSGPGLVDIYSWLRDSSRLGEPSWLKELFKEEDPARVITDCALGGKHALCVEALDAFASILGAVAGNLALTGLTMGGVYLGGGIPPKILPVLKSGRFLEAFLNKGRFSDLLKKIPIRVILNERAALLGAAEWAFHSVN
jgi:glucokinase